MSAKGKSWLRTTRRRSGGIDDAAIGEVYHVAVGEFDQAVARNVDERESGWLARWGWIFRGV